MICPECGSNTWKCTYRSPIDPAEDTFTCIQCGHGFRRYDPKGEALKLVKGENFMAYHANEPIDPKRPWQIISKIGTLCGKLRTREQAQAAVTALEEAEQAGTLPHNLSEWEGKAVLEAE